MAMFPRVIATTRFFSSSCLIFYIPLVLANDIFGYPSSTEDPFIDESVRCLSSSECETKMPFLSCQPSGFCLVDSNTSSWDIDNRTQCVRCRSESECYWMYEARCFIRRCVLRFKYPDACRWEFHFPYMEMMIGVGMITSFAVLVAFCRATCRRRATTANRPQRPPRRPSRPANVNGFLTFMHEKPLPKYDDAWANPPPSYETVMGLATANGQQGNSSQQPEPWEPPGIGASHGRPCACRQQSSSLPSASFTTAGSEVSLQNVNMPKGDNALPLANVANIARNCAGGSGQTVEVARQGQNDVQHSLEVARQGQNDVQHSLEVARQGQTDMQQAVQVARQAPPDVQKAVQVACQGQTDEQQPDVSAGSPDEIELQLKKDQQH